jgi:hypothetical protein
VDHLLLALLSEYPLLSRGQLVLCGRRVLPLLLLDHLGADEGPERPDSDADEAAQNGSSDAVTLLFFLRHVCV